MVTRVTNTMLQNTLLSNLNMNLGRMDKLQNQLSSGRKYGHISDDPSALIYGQAARNKLARLSHFSNTVETAQSWLTQAEAGVMELNKVVGAIYEELVSAGSVKTDPDKQILGMVVGQLRDHYVDTLNTAYGDRFVFGGYNTPGDFAAGRPTEIKPFKVVNDQLFFNGFNISQFDGLPVSEFDFAEFKRTGNWPDHSGAPAPNNPSPADFQRLSSLMEDVVSFDVGPGINMPVTQNGIDIVFFITRDDDGNPIMRNSFDLIQEIYVAVNGDPDAGIPPKGTDELTKLIGLIQDSQNHLLTRTAEIGGRQRRLELLEARYIQDSLNYEKMRSDAEDADLAEVIMFLKMAETVYQAALSAGARVIQPTLMDFLR